VTPITGASMLGDRKAGRSLEITAGEQGPRISLAGLHPNAHATVIRLDLASKPVVDTAIAPDSSGAVRLLAGSGIITGPGLKIETYPGADGSAVENLGYWNNTDAQVVWEARLEGGRSYSISLDHACKQGSEGGELEMTIGEETLIFTPAPTGGWMSFVDGEAGTFTADKSGAVEVQLRATKIPGEALINLRSILFTPR